MKMLVAGLGVAPMTKGLSESAVEARRHASAARENSLFFSDAIMKSEWLKVAKLWDRIAREYDQLQTSAKILI